MSIFEGERQNFQPATRAIWQDFGNRGSYTAALGVGLTCQTGVDREKNASQGRPSVVSSPVIKVEQPGNEGEHFAPGCRDGRIFGGFSSSKRPGFAAFVCRSAPGPACKPVG